MIRLFPRPPIRDKYGRLPLCPSAIVHSLQVSAMLAGHYLIQPRLMCQIPAHRLSEPSLKSHLRRPSEFEADSPCVDLVSPVMPRPVFHETHSPLQLGLVHPFFLCEHAAKGMDDFQVRTKTASAGIVG